MEDAKVAQVVTHSIAMANQEGWLPLEPKHAGGTGYAKAAFLKLPQPGPKVLIQVRRKKSPVRYGLNLIRANFPRRTLSKWTAT